MKLTGPFRFSWPALAAPAFLSCVLLASGASPDRPGDELWHHRNLGKAFYENPTTQLQAVDEFKKALDLAPDSARERVNYGLALLRAAKTADAIAELEKAKKQDPSIPQTWFNLGIALKRDSQYEKAIVEFEQMVKLVPDEPISHYNLGYLYKLTGKGEQALKEFETASRLDPNLAGPHFQLFNAYRDANRPEEAAKEQQIFQDLKRRQAGAAVPEDLDWSFYAEIYDPLDAVRKEPAPAPPTFQDATLPGPLATASAGLLVIDADGDGRPDLLAWSADGARLYKNGATPVEASGLEGVKNVRHIAAADYDNDGLADLCVVTDTGATLYKNAKGTFQKAEVALPAGSYTKAVWMDYDHDYDADLFLLGEKSALVRNNGRAGFSDQTADFPFVAGKAVDAVTFTLVPDTSYHDLLVSYADHGGALYRDGLGGKYSATTVLAPGAHGLVAQDLDGDGAMDVAVIQGGRLELLFNRRGKWAAETESRDKTDSRAIALADLNNRAMIDVLVDGQVLRDSGEPAGAAVRAAQPIAALKGAAAIVAADFDDDGLTDVAMVAADGAVHVLRNATPTTNRFVKVAITGVKNPRLAAQALVEVKAGASYQQRAYDGLPLTLGIRDYEKLDTVRITWPNGLIQNETQQLTGKALAFKEAQRLSGSCPMIFTWNGKQFQFITDVLGVAPLGASSGDGTYFPVDHDEYIQIPGSALALKDGAYEVRITEELREVSYLDHIQLIATDHPSSVDLFTNDKFKSPPFPEFRLFGATHRVYPSRAVDGTGRDVRPALMAKDRVYPDAFSRDFAGVAEMHTLDLDFGKAAPDNRAVLILNGWVDWADGSTFLGASQEDPQGLLFPSIQVKDGAGRWQTVVADMGIPAGKPKTISVDLTGKFLSASREVRIVTNLCLYWDEIFLSEDASAPTVAMTPIEAAIASLHYRGFSTPTIDPARKQPEAFDYTRVMPISQWNPTPGLYTRFGDVTPLVTGLDDRLLIMGSGDEVTLRFPAGGLPPLKPGWTRDFLLLVDGWAKDADANTAFSQSVEPLPFHGMSAYPYPANERFPDDEAHRRYRDEYNTRPALRLIRPMTSTNSLSTGTTR